MIVHEIVRSIIYYSTATRLCSALQYASSVIQITLKILIFLTEYV
jgi:hypothetical protein